MVKRMNTDKVIKGLIDVKDFLNVMAVVEKSVNELTQNVDNAIELIKELTAELDDVYENGCTFGLQLKATIDALRRFDV